jgi:hypothetical protein
MIFLGATAYSLPAHVPAKQTIIFQADMCNGRYMGCEAALILERDHNQASMRGDKPQGAKRQKKFSNIDA